MFITEGCRTYCYAIRLKEGRVRQNTDPYIFIGMTCRKRLSRFLDYFTNQVSEDDSFNHQTVRARLEADPTEVFYVNFIERFPYNPHTSRERVARWQRRYDVEIPYPIV